MLLVFAVVSMKRYTVMFIVSSCCYTYFKLDCYVKQHFSVLYTLDANLSNFSRVTRASSILVGQIQLYVYVYVC